LEAGKKTDCCREFHAETIDSDGCDAVAVQLLEREAAIIWEQVSKAERSSAGGVEYGGDVLPDCDFPLWIETVRAPARALIDAGAVVAVANGITILD